jgi:hypothetical protein
LDLRALLVNEERRQGERKLVATIREVEPWLREAPTSYHAEYYAHANVTVEVVQAKPFKGVLSAFDLVRARVEIASEKGELAEAYGTNIWTRTYRGNSDYGGARRLGWDA